MAVGTKLAFKRLGALDTVSNSVLTPAISRPVRVLPRGAQVNGSQSATSAVTVWPGHGITTGAKVMVALDPARYFTAGTVTATSIPVASGTVTVTDGEALVNLGADTGLTSPNYDDATVPIYSSADTTTALTPSGVTSNGSTGKYEYWSTERFVWELVLLAGVPNTLIRDIELMRVEEVLSLAEVAAGPATAPAQSAAVHIYLKGDKLILKFNDAGTTRYKSLDLTGTGVTWVHGTSEP